MSEDSCGRKCCRVMYSCNWRQPSERKRKVSTVVDPDLDFCVEHSYRTYIKMINIFGTNFSYITIIILNFGLYTVIPCSCFSDFSQVSQAYM